MHALQPTEQFRNGTYTVNCGNHNVTVVQAPQSKSNIKWRKHISINTST